METTVLFTSCCGWPTCGTIDALKHGSGSYRVIGCDCSPDPAALNYVDKLYRVPRCTESTYIDDLLAICKQEEVDVLVPLISDEIPVISADIELFESIGTKVLLSGKGSRIDVANDKGKLSVALSDIGVDVMPESRLLNPDTVMGDLVHFGWPMKPVCVKPVAGCGSAGFRVVDDYKAADYVLNSSRVARHNPYISARQLEAASFSHEGEFLVQEYLPGEELGTLCLVDHGRTVYSPSHRNFAMQNATAVSCELVDDDEANAIVARVNKLLNLDGNIGYDFKRDSEGRLKLLDVNPRISATVSLAAKAGLNLVEMGVLHALGKPIDENVVPRYGTKLMRNYGTLYSYEGEPCGR